MDAPMHIEKMKYQISFQNVCFNTWSVSIFGIIYCVMLFHILVKYCAKTR